MLKKRGQVSVEYLIVVGFVVFLVTGILGVGFFYSSNIRDSIRMNQLSSFFEEIVSNGESVFYAGEPSKVTINAYLPGGVQDIYIDGQDFIVVVSTDSGENTRSFSSNVPISESGSAPLTVNEGVKKIQIVAQEDEVIISEVS